MNFPPLLEGLINDIRYGCRMLLKSPAYTFVTVLTLGLGIGANTALFTVVNGVLLNPLPFPEPDRLVGIHENKPNFEGGSISYLNFRDWQQQNHTFSAMAIARDYGYTLTGLGTAETVTSEFISEDFFPLLGVNPVLGRSFTFEEEQVGAAPVALISAGFWQRKFGGALNVLGKPITLDGRNFTIIGVIPASFHLRMPSFRERDVYVPFGQWSNNLLLNRGAGLGIHGIGRIKPGVTLQQAQADMDSVTRNLSVAYPDFNEGISAKLVPLKRQIVGGVRPLLLLLLGAVGCVLLIACVNVANLLLARSTVRAHEFTIRAALGASRARMIRQLLTESALLGVSGGCLGWLVAASGTRAALALLPFELPRAEEIRLDGRVLLFTAAISIASGILFGLVPALRVSQSGLHDDLKQAARGVVAIRHRAQPAFVVVEMALALVLLMAAGLMVRSLSQLWKVDPGFDPHNVLTYGLSLPLSLKDSDPAAIRAAFREYDDRIRAIPGVTGISETWAAIPMDGDDERLFWLETEPKPASENAMHWAINYVVEPDYLKVMGLRLLRGRFLTERDNEHTPQMIVIDDVFANKYFPGQDPIGKQIVLNGDSSLAEIVGIVGHVKQWGLDTDDTQAVRAEFYLAGMQTPDSNVGSMLGANVVVRSNGSTAGLLDAIQHATGEKSERVIYGAETMDSVISHTLAARSFSMILLGAFAALSLILASVGIYGVISYLVGQRAHEIGVRIALGAQRRDVLRLVLGQAGRMAALGIAIGCVAGIVATRFLAGLLYGVKPTDPVTFLGVSLLIALVALLACYIPARRALRVDPAISLRYE